MQALVLENYFKRIQVYRFALPMGRKGFSSFGAERPWWSTFPSDNASRLSSVAVVESFLTFSWGCTRPFNLLLSGGSFSRVLSHYFNNFPSLITWDYIYRIRW